MAKRRSGGLTGVVGPRSRGQRPRKPPFSNRLWQVLKDVKAVVWAIAGVIAAVTGWYAKTYLEIEHDRERRLHAVDAFLSTLKRDRDPRSRQISLDSLELARLTDHLEPHVIVGLLQMVRSERPLQGRCAAAQSGATDGFPSDLARALRIVWDLQQREQRVHPFVDRLVDRTLERFEPALVEPPRAISLANTDLRGADMHGIMLQSASFHGACLAGAQLDSAFLDGTDFSGATLRSANVADARGKKTKFVRAVLVDADLSGATFSSANFRGADLSCATLGNARLDSAYFSDAVARWAYFGGANLQGADKWNEVRDLRGVYVSSVVGLSDSLLAWTRARGAVTESEAQDVWTNARMAQLRPGGLCAPPA